MRAATDRRFPLVRTTWPAVAFLAGVGVLLASSAQGNPKCPSPPRRNTQLLESAAAHDLTTAEQLDKLAQACASAEPSPQCAEAKRACRTWGAENGTGKARHDEAHLLSQMR